MVATSSRIDPRVKRTRKLLLDAFMGVIAEKSFDEITVQDITARATVNRATFYAHFVDKYALVDELIREGFTQMLQQCMATPAHSTEEQVRRLIRAVCDYWTELHSQCKHSYPLFDSLVEAQVKAQLREQVRSSMLARGGPRSHSHPRVELLATIVSWAIYGAALEWSQRMGGQSAEAFVEEALPLIAASIAAFEERAR
ncbi:MAG TPA: TetR/AcrR family transcriptional regulator [Roseiflexaceae bacterium]|nr:TetR/AcrR family transcriptional regulator [Roseiflexaceae bacterium]